MILGVDISLWIWYYILRQGGTPTKKGENNMLKGKHYENKVFGGYTVWDYKGAIIEREDNAETYRILFVTKCGQKVFWSEPTFEKALEYVDKCAE